VGARRGRPASASPGRLIFLLAAVVLLFSAMAARLVVLQVVEAPTYARLAAHQRARELELPARRGVIFDRDGEPLAIAIDLELVFADPALVERPRAEARALAPLLGLPVRAVEAKLARRIEALELAGVYTRAEPVRYYPNGRLASQVLGFVNTEGEGSAGIELAYDDVLKGVPGRMVLEQDPSGRALLQADFRYDAPEPGRSLFLTIDKDLQYFTETALRAAVQRYSARGGTVIVMQPASGQILALANVPDFDPNRYGEARPAALKNAAVTDVYEPGSAFKVVTFAAALEEGVITPDTELVVPDHMQVADRVFNDSHSHPTQRMTAARVLAESSNVGTIKIGLELGARALARWIERFGFGSKTGLALPGESAGIVPPLELWSGSSIATLPIGQGIAVTPLQMASAYALLANDGVWVEPKLLYGTMDERGELIASSPPSTRRVLSRATAATMTELLVGVVERGTGVEAQVPGYAVAGKTGTAQKPAPGGYGDSYIASFAGYAPAQRPEVVVLVVLDDPSPIWGGATAAPTFREIAGFALRHFGVKPTGNAESTAEELDSAPPAEPAHD
jgi:cell division protein FtsI (penicillin-binding protein 3)